MAHESCAIFLDTQSEPMIIAIAGPYSAPTEALREQNLSALNHAAAKVLEKGHIPLIGVNAALPVIAAANIADRYKAIMDISMAAIAHCEALLLIGESPGANREKDYVLSKGLPVFYTLDEIPS